MPLMFITLNNGIILNVGLSILLQTFRRLLLKQCEEEFNNRTKASQGNRIINSNLQTKSLGFLYTAVD